MSWQRDTALRDLDPDAVVETTCLRCGHTWRHTATSLLLKVCHRDVRLDEVARSLACPRQGCRYVGVRLALIPSGGTSAFVGGMP